MWIPGAAHAAPGRQVELVRAVVAVPGVDRVVVAGFALPQSLPVAGRRRRRRHVARTAHRRHPQHQSGQQQQHSGCAVAALSTAPPGRSRRRHGLAGDLITITHSCIPSRCRSWKSVARPERTAESTEREEACTPDRITIFSDTQHDNACISMPVDVHPEGRQRDRKVREIDPQLAQLTAHG